MRASAPVGDSAQGACRSSQSRASHEPAAEEESMRIRSTLAIMLAGALLVAACGAGASPGSKWKIAVHTDVGSIDDKNFNQYSYAGAVDGAAAIGADKPPYIVPKDVSELPAGLQGFIDAGKNIIVVNGFNAIAVVTKFAKA